MKQDIRISIKIVKSSRKFIKNNKAKIINMNRSGVYKLICGSFLKHYMDGKFLKGVSGNINNLSLSKIKEIWKCFILLNEPKDKLSFKLLIIFLSNASLTTM